MLTQRRWFHLALILGLAGQALITSPWGLGMGLWMLLVLGAACALHPRPGRFLYGWMGGAALLVLVGALLKDPALNLINLLAATGLALLGLAGRWPVTWRDWRALFLLASMALDDPAEPMDPKPEGPAPLGPVARLLVGLPLGLLLVLLVGSLLALADPDFRAILPSAERLAVFTDAWPQLWPRLQSLLLVLAGVAGWGLYAGFILGLARQPWPEEPVRKAKPAPGASLFLLLGLVVVLGAYLVAKFRPLGVPAEAPEDLAAAAWISWLLFSLATGLALGTVLYCQPRMGASALKRWLAITALGLLAGPLWVAVATLAGYVRALGWTESRFWGAAVLFLLGAWTLAALLAFLKPSWSSSALAVGALLFLVVSINLLGGPCTFIARDTLRRAEAGRHWDPDYLAGLGGAARLLVLRAEAEHDCRDPEPDFRPVLGDPYDSLEQERRSWTLIGQLTRKADRRYREDLLRDRSLALSQPGAWLAEPLPWGRLGPREEERNALRSRHLKVKVYRHRDGAGVTSEYLEVRHGLPGRYKTTWLRAEALPLEVLEAEAAFVDLLAVDPRQSRFVFALTATRSNHPSHELFCYAPGERRLERLGTIEGGYLESVVFAGAYAELTVFHSDSEAEVVRLDLRR